MGVKGGAGGGARCGHDRHRIYAAALHCVRQYVCVCVCVVVAPLLGHCFPKGGGSKVCCKEGGQEGAARRVEQGMLCKEGREGVA